MKLHLRLSLDYLLLSMEVETSGPLLLSLMLHGLEKLRRRSLLLLPLVHGMIPVSLDIYNILSRPPFGLDIY